VSEAPAEPRWPVGATPAPLPDRRASRGRRLRIAMSKRERTRLLTSLGIAAGIGLLLVIAYQGFHLFTTVQQTSHDLFYRLQNPERYGDIPSRFVIIAIDSKTLDRLGRWSGWDRTNYARVIDTARAGNARVVAFDVGFFETAPGDAELARAIREAGFVVQPIAGKFVDESPDASGMRRLKDAEWPLPSLREGTAVFGSANVTTDADGSVRTIPLVVAVDDFLVPALSFAAVAEYLRQPPQLDQRPPVFRYVGREIPITASYGMRVNYVGEPSLPDRAQTFKTVSFVDVLEGQVPPETFRDKIVFVGLLGAAGFADDYWTPVSRPQTGKMAGVEIHVNAAATLVRAAFLTPEDPVATVATILLFALIAGLVAARFDILRSLVGVVVIGIAYLVVASQLFDRGQLVNLVYPLAALALPYSGMAIYRVMFEQRQVRFLRGAMGRYLSPTVMEAIVREPELLRLGGEKREMTVLFSDIRGFTTFSEQLDPQDLVSLLNEYLTAMTEVIYRYDGVLDKYMGDAIMAFWNSPVTQPDHARRACLAALDMVEELDRLRERWKSRGIPPLDMGVGLNTGPMSVGNMGSDTRFDYTVMGDAVNLGSRLEGANKEYHTSICISQFTLDAVKDEGFVLRFLDLVAVKGRAQPVAVYELIGRPGSFGPFTPEILALYERGTEQYRAQEFAAAGDTFREVLRHRPGDGPSAMYLERSLDLLEAPPPHDWDGVFVMTHK
jgi:adenylate cyclase